MILSHDNKLKTSWQPYREDNHTICSHIRDTHFSWNTWQGAGEYFQEFVTMWITEMKLILDNQKLNTFETGMGKKVF